MPDRPPRYRPPVAPRQVDVSRPTAAARGYGSRWQRARLAFLAANPLCVRCEAEGRTTAATDVDHDTPHCGDYTLFWDESNWRSLCRSCHSKKTANEDGGFGRSSAAKPGGGA